MDISWLMPTGYQINWLLKPVDPTLNNAHKKDTRIKIIKGKDRKKKGDYQMNYFREKDDGTTYD